MDKVTEKEKQKLERDMRAARRDERQTLMDLDIEQRERQLQSLRELIGEFEEKSKRTEQSEFDLDDGLNVLEDVHGLGLIGIRAGDTRQDVAESGVEDEKKAVLEKEEDKLGYAGAITGLPPTPSFLKDREEVLLDLSKSIHKRSSTPADAKQVDQEKQRDYHSHKEQLDEGSYMSNENSILDRVIALQLQAEEVAEENRRRISEKRQVEERMMELEKRREYLNAEMKRRKELIRLREDEERLGRLLRQQQQEEMQQKQNLQLLYRREAELKRELEDSERQLWPQIEDKDSERWGSRARIQEIRSTETEPVNILGRIEEDRRKSSLFKPHLMPQGLDNVEYRTTLRPEFGEKREEDWRWKNKGEERRLYRKGIDEELMPDWNKETAQNVKSEERNVEDQQSLDTNERSKLLKYLSKLEAQLTAYKEAEKKRLQEQKEAVRKEDGHTKQLEQGEELPKESSVNVEKESFDQREREIDRREKYLKSLEKELTRKENEIRCKLNLNAVTEDFQDKEEEFDNCGDIINEPVTKAEVTHLVKPYVNSFSGVDPIPKNESSFEDWRLETQYLIGADVYPEYIVNQAIRNSLRGQARKVLLTLGPNATSAQIRNKLESVFGNVASGESVLQDFYNATQKEDESVILWGIRLEEIFQKAKEKGHAKEHQKDKMLKTKFWRGLRNAELKNALRADHDKEKIDFEKLRTKARTVEYEMLQDKVVLNQEKGKAQKTSTSGAKTDKEKSKEKESNSKVEMHNQSVQQGSNSKLLEDIVKKMESFEKRLDNIGKSRPYSRPFNRGRGRGRGGPQTKTHQSNNASAQDKKGQQKPLN